MTTVGQDWRSPGQDFGADSLIHLTNKDPHGNAREWRYRAEQNTLDGFEGLVSLQILYYISYAMVTVSVT